MGLAIPNHRNQRFPGRWLMQFTARAHHYKAAIAIASHQQPECSIHHSSAQPSAHAQSTETNRLWARFLEEREWPARCCVFAPL